MIFTPEHVEMVKQGIKTQTRRLNYFDDTMFIDNNGEIIEVHRNGRLKWQVGRDYALQPGRTAKADGRFLLKRIRLEHLYDISEDDAWAEGEYFIPKFSRVWDSVSKKAGTRWRDNPSVYALDIEYVEAQNV